MDIFRLALWMVAPQPEGKAEWNIQDSWLCHLVVLKIRCSPHQASHYVLHLRAPPAPNPGSDLEHQTIRLWRYFEGYGTFRRWGLAGGNRSLGAGL